MLSVRLQAWRHAAALSTWAVRRARVVRKTRPSGALCADCDRLIALGAADEVRGRVAQGLGAVSQVFGEFLVGLSVGITSLPDA